MAELLLYYITDRAQLPGDDSARRAALLDRVEAAAHVGVDYIQLREKDLTARALEALARDCTARIAGSSAKLLVNSRIDVAVAAGAHGVHLPADDISAAEARRVFLAGGTAAPVIAVSCHSLEEARRAHADGADFIVFGPVFEKTGEPGVGLERLRATCDALPGLRVLALGGVTTQNAAECAQAGAAGVAGIRLFQNGDINATLRTLRA